MTQNARQLPARSVDSGGALDLSYAYDSHGNVITITDGTSGARQSRSMIYDGFDRLRQTTGVSFTAAAYTYDALDNLKTLNVTGGSAPRSHTYLYDATNRLSSVINTVGGATVIGLSYDVQGNLANKNGQLYQFDYGNRLRNVPGKESYRYDRHGRRVMSYTTTHSLWQYGNSGAMYYSHDARNNRATSYIQLQGSLLATRETPITGGTGTYTVKYQHTDALGTPIKTTDVTGAVVETSEYEPYGQLVNRPITDGPGYTGHVQDAATGLTYMQQRYYDPQIGRFLSVDPVTAYSNGDIRFFNRYVYAFNNPYRFTDPDGRATCADKNCAKSTIDSTLVKPGLLPPAVNGNAGLSNTEANLRQTSVVTVTFQNDNPNGASPNQPIATKTANAVEKAILDSGVSSVNVNSTTGGKHGERSAHYQARAVDINRVNGQRVTPSNTAAASIQQAARQGGSIRENFGPTIMEKTTVPGGSPAPVTNQSLIDAHQNHLHLSGQP